VALVAAIGSASRRGVLFKGGAAIEALAGVRTLAFDKTGTLTEGHPAVATVVTLGSLSEEEILRRAAALNARATHPLGRGIVRAALDLHLAIPAARAERVLPGLGVRGEVEGETILAGSRRLFPNLDLRGEHELEAIELAGQTAILVGAADRVHGVIAMADPIRPGSAHAVRELGSLGLRTVMLTGDNQRTASRIGQAAGVAEIRAQLLPVEKVEAVSELQRAGAVAMIGDGVNDAPALATAEVGIAMGAGGADVAIEAADVVLVRDDLSRLPVAVRLARRTMATIRENIAASILVKAAFLVLTFAGFTNLWLAVLADMGMSLAVTANSLRLIRTPHRHQPAAATAPAPAARP
jgi:Cd2+/Zn2+-exporting ATPase